MFDLYTFGDVCLHVIPIVVVLSLFISGFLGALARHSKNGLQITIFFSYLVCVGVIVHELAHQLMCKLFGARIKGIQYFGVNRQRIAGREYTSIGGHVDCEEVPSIIAGMYLGLAPLLVNGLLIAIIYFYWPVLGETAYNWLFIYLGIALALGARPSKEDLTVWWHTFQKNLGRSFWELFLLCLFGGVLYCLIVYQVELWISLSVIIGFIVLSIIEGRAKSGMTQARQFTDS